MLNEKRIKEAETNVRGYLQERLIGKYDVFREEILETYKRNYQESLDLAQKIFEQNLSNLWTVVISYYSMYYIANAVLYKIGYKVGHKVSHKVTADALIVFVRNKLKKNLLEDFEQAKDEALDIIGRKTDEIIGSFDKELEKRSVFQYESTEQIKQAKAKTSLERAKAFIFEMKKLL
jgi:uncharacterized protein (UPF0332 family)